MTTTNSTNVKNIICETDIGRDPDDFFALCYLQSVGVNIRAITIADGDPLQVALIRFFCKEVGLDIPVGVASMDRKNPEYGGKNFHHNLLDHYGYPHEAKADDLGYKIIQNVYGQYPDSEFFIIGAPKSTGKFIETCNSALASMRINQVTFQGGFMAYHVHNISCERLEKFEGKTVCPSFNPNGDIKGTEAIIACPNIDHIRFVSKNVCHTIVYDKATHDLMKLVDPKNRADEIFLKGMDIYLAKHSEKKFHDPCAAVCMIHPEIARWVRGRMYHEKGGWGTKPDSTSNSETIASIDKDRFWNFMLDKE